MNFTDSGSNITQLRNFKNPKTVQQECLLITYMIMLAIISALFAMVLYKLIKLLKGATFKRLDSEDLITGDFFSLDPKVSARAIARIYFDCMTVNNNHLEQRFQDYNSCLKMMFPVIGLSLIETFLSNFL